jgi:DNA-binding LacI/PurR family transcriptional regulator
MRLCKIKEISMLTMSDIARRAGVAVSTVSHTLSGKRPVSAEVRQRVLHVINELEYEPNAVARALATKRSRMVALLYPTLSNDLPEPHLEFVSGVLEVTNQRKYGLLLWTTPNKDQEILHMIQQGFIDGLVVMEIRLEDPRVTILKEQRYPFTLIGRCKENDGINFVDLDFNYALHTCVEYLARLGHTHLAAQAGYEVVRTLLAKDPSLTAIITSNPWVSGGITRAIYDQGLKVPEDISLVGIVSSLITELTTPALTAVDFPFHEMGHMAADMLIRQLEGEDVSTQLLLKPPLTVRQSSGPSRK